MNTGEFRAIIVGDRLKLYGYPGTVTDAIESTPDMPELAAVRLLCDDGTDGWIYEDHAQHLTQEAPQ